MSADLSALVASVEGALAPLFEQSFGLETSTWHRLATLAEDWRRVVDMFGPAHPFSTLCLLSLVREAWGDPTANLTPDGKAATWALWVGPGRWDYSGEMPAQVFEGDTEAEALTAALLAAPPKDGGGS